MCLQFFCTRKDFHSNLQSLILFRPSGWFHRLTLGCFDFDDSVIGDVSEDRVQIVSSHCCIQNLSRFLSIHILEISSTFLTPLHSSFSSITLARLTDSFTLVKERKLKFNSKFCVKGTELQRSS